jgi:hypothetical protein
LNIDLSHSNPTFLRTGLLVIAGLCILSIASLVIGHLVLTSWRDIFFFNSDSLTLPLLLRSVLAGEPFEWRFSSQLFFFPEAFLYFISAWLTPSIEWSLVLNALFNFLLFVGLLIWLGALSGLSLIGRLAFALLEAMLISLYIVLEPSPAVNQTALVSLSLFNTYYFGAILSGFFVLAINLHLISLGPAFTHKSHSTPFLAGTGVLVLALTYGSNPLFLLQCSLPLLICLFALYRFKGISRSTFVALLGIQVIGLFLGQCLRWYFSDAIGRSVSRYIDIKSILQSFKLFAENAKLIWASPASRFEYLLIFLTFCLAFFCMVNLWRRFFLGRKEIAQDSQSFNIPLLLLVSFSFIAPLFSTFGVLASGNYLMRYFLPLAFFPILAASYYIGLAVNAFKFTGRPLLIGYACLALCAPMSLVFTANYVSPGSGSLLWWTQSRPFSLPQSVSCINENFIDSPINLVGSFWTSRPIDLYTSAPVRVLQVGPGLKPYFWMNNQAPYKVLDINGVIVDKPEGVQKWPGYLYEEDLPMLGQFSQRIECERIWIYLFNKDSEGFGVIQKLIRN